MTTGIGFNPRPRTGGDEQPREAYHTCQLDVSIRAPARGATGERARRQGALAHRFQSAPPHGGRPSKCAVTTATARMVFQSAPPHGGRPRSGLPEHGWLQRRFNPRPPHGGRRSQSDRVSALHRRGFNPRPRTGGDSVTLVVAAASVSFNPRPRTGGDPRSPTWICVLDSFNPRPRTGGDPGPMGLSFNERDLFQSAPPHGGRRAVA